MSKKIENLIDTEHKKTCYKSVLLDFVDHIDESGNIDESERAFLLKHLLHYVISRPDDYKNNLTDNEIYNELKFHKIKIKIYKK